MTIPYNDEIKPLKSLQSISEKWAEQLKIEIV